MTLISSDQTRLLFVTYEISLDTFCIKKRQTGTNDVRSKWKSINGYKKADAPWGRLKGKTKVTGIFLFHGT